VRIGVYLTSKKYCTWSGDEFEVSVDLAWEKDYMHIYIYIYIFERRIMCVLVCNRIIGMIVCLVFG